MKAISSIRTNNPLERITTYRLVLYFLIILLVGSLELTLIGVLHYSAAGLAVSSAILLVSCYLTNKALSYVFKAPTNTESSLITALILALIITPISSFSLVSLAFPLMAGIIAMASKYILTINRKHIFNPAAIAVVLTSLIAHQTAGWWVDNKILLPFVLLGGLVIVIKIRRVRMVSIFFLTTLLATTLYSLMTNVNALSSLNMEIVSSSMLFLGFIMLTEPSTSPTTFTWQAWYAIFLGILFPAEFRIFNLALTPEIALCSVNLVYFIFYPRVKLFPKLIAKIILTPNSGEFVFANSQNFNYLPGQYMEWTLPHKGTDSRGNRRYFTLASSPTEKELKIGVKFYKKGSSYKNALFNMEAETPIVAEQSAGNFVLPKNIDRKLIFIAGGIGITPFRSMLKYLIDIQEPRDIILLYSIKSPKDAAYKELLKEARHYLGVRTIFVLTGTSAVAGPNVKTGRINKKLISEVIPDYKERLFYISGAQPMIKSTKAVLKDLGIHSWHIKTDSFDGYLR